MIYEKFKETLSLNSRFIMIESPSNYANLDIAYTLMQDGYIYPCANKVDDVRDVINKSYKQTSKTFYLFADADDMSTAAKNALLKVTEEPPQNAYFIMCIKSRQNMLNTLISRASIISLPVLTPKEIGQYAFEKNMNISSNDLQIIKQTCTTIEQVNYLMNLKNTQGKSDIQGFVDYVDKVVDNLSVVTITNALKILNVLKFKPEEENKYDLTLFLNIYLDKIINRYIDGDINIQELNAIKETTCYTMTKLNINSINKQNLIEMWLMQQWEILGGEQIED